MPVTKKLAEPIADGIARVDIQKDSAVWVASSATASKPIKKNLNHPYQKFCGSPAPRVPAGTWFWAVMCQFGAWLGPVGVFPSMA